MAFISYLFLIVPVCFIGIGCFLFYSAISKKGITKPDKDAPFQLYTQFRLRGLIGVGLIFFGLLTFIEFVKEFL